MAAKDKIETGFRFWFDDSGGTPRDLSDGLIPGSFNGGGKTLDQVDMTGVSNAVRNYLGGHAEAPVSAKFLHDDTASTGAHTVLKDMVGSVGTLTAQWGSAGVAPAAGDPEWEGEYLCVEARVAFEGGKSVINAQFLPGTSTPPAWGVYA
jgi:hypothetical protein